MSSNASPTTASRYAGMERTPVDGSLARGSSRVRDQSVTTDELSSHLAQKPQARDLRLHFRAVARGGGLEPPMTGPEPAVLPITPPPKGGADTIPERLGGAGGSGHDDEIVDVRAD